MTASIPSLAWLAVCRTLHTARVDRTTILVIVLDAAQPAGAVWRLGVRKLDTGHQYYLGGYPALADAKRAGHRYVGDE